MFNLRWLFKGAILIFSILCLIVLISLWFHRGFGGDQLIARGPETAAIGSYLADAWDAVGDGQTFRDIYYPMDPERSGEGTKYPAMNAKHDFLRGTVFVLTWWIVGTLILLAIFAALKILGAIFRRGANVAGNGGGQPGDGGAAPAGGGGRRLTLDDAVKYLLVGVGGPVLLVVILGIFGLKIIPDLTSWWEDRGSASSLVGRAESYYVDWDAHQRYEECVDRRQPHKADFAQASGKVMLNCLEEGQTELEQSVASRYVTPRLIDEWVGLVDAKYGSAKMGTIPAFDPRVDIITLQLIADRAHDLESASIAGTREAAQAWLGMADRQSGDSVETRQSRQKIQSYLAEVFQRLYSSPNPLDQEVAGKIIGSGLIGSYCIPVEGRGSSLPPRSSVGEESSLISEDEALARSCRVVGDLTTINTTSSTEPTEDDSPPSGRLWDFFKGVAGYIDDLPVTFRVVLLILGAAMTVGIAQRFTGKRKYAYAALPVLTLLMIVYPLLPL